MEENLCLFEKDGLMDMQMNGSSSFFFFFFNLYIAIKKWEV